jgi:hypothetical protein
MLKRTAIIFFTIFCAVTAYGQPALIHQRVDEDAVLTTYSVLVPLTTKEQIAIARELPDHMRAALWLVHLNGFLRTHPELTDDQKLIVYQAIGFAASGNLEIPRTSVVWQTKVLPMLGRLKKAVELEFPADLALEAFYHIGTAMPGAPRASEPIIDHERLLGTHTALHPIPLFVDCDCNSENHLFTTCGSPSSPERCRVDGQHQCTPHVDCGFLWADSCDGLCV